MVNKTVRFVKKNPLTIRFSKLDPNNSMLVVFCDAAFANLKDGSSQCGFIILIMSKTGKCCTLSWQSRKIKRVCKSTLAAESWAMIEAIETCEVIVVQLCESVTDCKSLFDAIKTSNNVEDKGLRIPIACLRQRVNNNEMTVKWIRTKNQLADPFTKAGASSTLLRAVLSNGELDAELFNLVFNQ